MNPRSVGAVQLIAPAQLPEVGTWYRTDRSHEGQPVWARVPLEGDGHEDEDAIALAWERLRHMDHPMLPKALTFDADARVLLVTAPEGVSLQRLIEHRTEAGFTMTPATVLDVGVALADLLVHAHEKGRPHGHLSPASILLSPTGGLVVWGYAAGPDTAGPTRWWPPERARGRRASGDADQWALGAILAAMVTARVPWRSDDPITEARVGDASHLSGPVVDQWKPLGRVVERMLQAETRDRYPSIHPVRQALGALRQRVPAAGELEQLGAALAGIYLQPAPRRFEEESFERPTTVSAEEPPLDAPDPSMHASLAPPLLGVPIELEALTDIDTSPTRIPNEQDPPSRIDEPLAPVPLAPEAAYEEAYEPSLPELASSSFESDEDDAWLRTEAHPAVPAPKPFQPEVEAPEPELPGDPPSSGVDVAVAEREASPLRDDLAWYERVDARRVAPWIVSALAVMLVIYLGWLLS